MSDDKPLSDLTPEELRLRTELDRSIAYKGLHRLLDAVGASAMRGAFGKYADEDAEGPQVDVRRASARVSRRRGRPPLTEAVVRAELRRAVARLVDDRGIAVPVSWEQLASAHDGQTEWGMTVDGLRKRRDKFPEPFRDLVPHLME